MASQNKMADRIRDLAIAVLAAALALWLTGCDVGGGEDAPDSGAGGVGPGLERSDAGVTHCQISSPSGDVAYTYSNGAKSTYTMRQWFERAADSGAPGYWGVVDNLPDFKVVCESSKAYPAGTCDAALANQVKYCFYADYRWDAASGSAVYHFRAGTMVLGGWEGDSRKVYAALCTPEGVFAGWICSQ